MSRNRLVTRNVNGELAACSVAGGISSRVRHDMFSDSKKRPGLLGLYDVRDGHVVSERGFRPLCRGVGLERIESDVHIVRAILHCRCLLIWKDETNPTGHQQQFDDRLLKKDECSIKAWGQRTYLYLELRARTSRWPCTLSRHCGLGRKSPTDWDPIRLAVSWPNSVPPPHYWTEKTKMSFSRNLHFQCLIVIQLPGPVDVSIRLRYKDFNRPFTRIQVHIHVTRTIDTRPRMNCVTRLKKLNSTGLLEKQWTVQESSDNQKEERKAAAAGSERLNFASVSHLS